MYKETYGYIIFSYDEDVDYNCYKVDKHLIDDYVKNDKDINLIASLSSVLDVTDKVYHVIMNFGDIRNVINELEKPFTGCSKIYIELFNLACYVNIKWDELLKFIDIKYKSEGFLYVLDMSRHIDQKYSDDAEPDFMVYNDSKVLQPLDDTTVRKYLYEYIIKNAVCTEGINNIIYVPVNEDSLFDKELNRWFVKHEQHNICGVYGLLPISREYLDDNLLYGMMFDYHCPDNNEWDNLYLSMEITVIERLCNIPDLPFRNVKMPGLTNYIVRPK
jgi:hypothetical protein